jgi:hypothetical protein
MAARGSSGSAAYIRKGALPQIDRESTAAQERETQRMLATAAAGVGLGLPAATAPGAAGVGLALPAAAVVNEDDVLPPPDGAGIATIRVSSTASSALPAALPALPAALPAALPPGTLLDDTGLRGFRLNFAKESNFNGITFSFPSWSTPTVIYKEFIKPHLNFKTSKKIEGETSLGSPKSPVTSKLQEDSPEDDEKLNEFLEQAKEDEGLQKLYDTFNNGTEIEGRLIKVNLASFLSDLLVKYHKENPTEEFDSQTFLVYIANTAKPPYIKQTVKYPEEILNMKQKTKEQKEEKLERQEEHILMLTRVVMMLRQTLPQNLIKGGYDE